MVETAARRRQAWPRIRRGVAGVLAVGFVVAFAIALIGARTAVPIGFTGFTRFVPPHVIVTVIAVAFVSVGTLILLEPGQRVNGALFVGVGILSSVGWLSPLQRSAPVAVLIHVSGVLPYLCLGWVLLRYPEQRLARWYERAFVVVAAVWVIGWQSLVTITWPPRWVDGPQTAGWPWWLPNYELNEAAQRTLEVGAVAFFAGFIVLMIMRFFRTRGLDRAVYRPTYVAAGAWAVATFADALSTVGRPDVGSFTWPAYLPVEWLALIIVPVVLLYGVLRRRLARSRVADLVMRVNLAASPDAVEGALRRTMADPGLTVMFWSADLGQYVDVGGQPVTGVPPAGRLAFPVTNRNGEPLAVVHADASVAHHRNLLDAALATSSLALENAALHASLLARLAEVRESRARLAETAVAERRRIEQDLHDGAQQALLALGLTLGRAQAAADAATAAGLLTQARGELTTALQELRDLASGLHPAVLSQLGLGPALEVVAERLPVSVSLDVPARRWPEAAETTAYFVACEALTNVVKHADATRVRVAVADRADRILLRVDDDGRGGAHLGHGLLGIRDRAAALGGTLAVTSRAGHGTAIQAELPCE